MIIKTVLTAFSAAMCLAIPQAYADDLQGVWFVGGGVDDSQSGYAGAVVALPGGRLGSGWAVRGTATAGSYDYVTGGQKINGDYIGGDVALVYQVSPKWGWASFSIGPRVTDTRLRPSDPANKREGTRFDVGFQSDGAIDGRQWRASWLVAYAPFDEAYQTQVRMTHKLGDGRYRAGIEAGIVGDPSFSKKNVGLHGALPFIGKSEVQIGSGVTFQEGRSGRAYGALGISSVF